MSERPRAYRFRTAAQWQRCLLHGVELGRDRTLQPIARFGTSARQLTTTGPVSLVATDVDGAPVWRVDLADQHLLFTRTPLDETSQPLRLGEPLAHASRWVLDRHSIWAFAAGSPIVQRADRETVQDDMVVDLRQIAWPAAIAPEAIVDIAGDAHDGLWLLVDTSGSAERSWLVHLDCHGRLLQLHAMPVAVHGPLQIATAACGKRIVVLAAHSRLFLVEAETSELIRAVSEWNDDPCWRPRRVTSDEANRIAILCDYCGDEARWAVFVLDGEGDAIDRVTGPQQRLVAKPHDVAIAADVLWLAAADGLWRLDSSDASVARESESVLVTPALFSPETGRGGGWLRAEVDVELPPGAVLEVEAVSTNQTDIINRAATLAADTSRSTQQRQQAIWDLFDHPAARIFHLSAPLAAGHPLAIPLFDVADRWLWLRVKLVTPPGSIPPALREMRILYPDESLMQHIPGVFRGRENDPTRFLRSLVGVLEATTQEVDEKIRSIASQIEPQTAPEQWLDYVAGWLDLPWENALPLDAKRRLVAAAGALLDQRGTRRGLEQLLRALLGTKARIRVTDLTVDHPPTRLAGAACGTGARLPILLAGPLRSAPVLGTRTVLGRVCLGTPADPMRTLLPTLRIEVEAPRTSQRSIRPLLERILAQYVPAGIRVVVTWRLMAEALSAHDEGDADDVLDANGPGWIGRDSEIGRVVLGGRRGTLDDAGLDVGFPLS